MITTCGCDDSREIGRESDGRDLRRCKKVSKEREGARSRATIREREKETTDEIMEADTDIEKRTRCQPEERSTASNNRKRRKTHDNHE